jgi:hypothetical protein
MSVHAVPLHIQVNPVAFSAYVTLLLFSRTFHVGKIEMIGFHFACLVYPKMHRIQKLMMQVLLEQPANGVRAHTSLITKELSCYH